ncbi:hypothetical protein D9M68_810860 [compost metagenome]|jgi:hypothetical protein
MSHLTLVDRYPTECETFGYKVVGLAERQALAELPASFTKSQLKANTRALLADPASLAVLRQAAALMTYDPWLWAIEREQRASAMRRD